MWPVPRGLLAIGLQNSAPCEVKHSTATGRCRDGTWWWPWYLSVKNIEKNVKKKHISWQEDASMPSTLATAQFKVVACSKLKLSTHRNRWSKYCSYGTLFLGETSAKLNCRLWYCGYQSWYWCCEKPWICVINMNQSIISYIQFYIIYSTNIIILIDTTTVIQPSPTKSSLLTSAPYGGPWLTCQVLRCSADSAQELCGCCAKAPVLEVDSCQPPRSWL